MRLRQILVCVIGLATTFVGERPLFAQATPPIRDPRIELIPGSSDWNSYTGDRGNILDAIGIVENASSRKVNKHGTGFLFNKCYFATAQHVAFPTTEERRSKYIEFSVGYTANARQPWKHHRMTGAVVASGEKYLPEKFPSQDWVVARLDQCLDGHPTLAITNLDVDMMVGREIQVLGFPNFTDNLSNKFHLFVQTDCRILGNDQDFGYSTNCSITDGQSGGPVIARNNNGQWRSIGLNVLGFGDTGIIDPKTTKVADGNRFMSFAQTWTEFKEALSKLQD